MEDNQTKYILRLERCSGHWEQEIDFFLPTGSYVVPFDMGEDVEAQQQPQYIVESCTYFAFEKVCEITVARINEASNDIYDQSIRKAMLQAGWCEIKD